MTTNIVVLRPFFQEHQCLIQGSEQDKLPSKETLRKYAVQAYLMKIKKKFTAHRDGKSRFFAVSKWLSQVPGMVRPTFFLWQINQKLFFLLSFHILVTRNNNFCHPGGSQWGPRGLLAHFGPKKAIFEQFSIKFYFFFAF